MNHAQLSDVQISNLTLLGGEQADVDWRKVARAAALEAGVAVAMAVDNKARSCYSYAIRQVEDLLERLDPDGDAMVEAEMAVQALCPLPLKGGLRRQCLFAMSCLCGADTHSH